MLELILALLGELVLQLFAEGVIEVILHTLAAPFRRRPNAWLAGIGYLLFGAMLGGLSLLVLPAHFTPPALRLANLIFTPVGAGLGMAALGAWRARRGQFVLRLDTFSFGYLFALALALVRFLFAR